MLKDVPKIPLADRLDGKFDNDRTISCAKRAARRRNLLLQSALARFEVGQALTVILFGHDPFFLMGLPADVECGTISCRCKVEGNARWQSWGKHVFPDPGVAGSMKRRSHWRAVEFKARPRRQCVMTAPADRHI
ncbi:hypothetical protein [Sphingobium sp. AP50]|uniref:hypothetical protein n=1 Tax=Sphingobium sp. AP50 TaxID=1884369 RepID=UPI0015A5A456|nr:hypothetical protein [Sphingobium sp. AP50]